MDKTIWKFQLYVTDVQVLQMPAGAQILSVQAQRDRPCIWALVEPNNPMESRTLRTYGTGHGFDSTHPSEFIGTYQIAGGSLVFHVFEEMR